MKSKTGAGILLISVFLLGGMTGALAHYIYQTHLRFGPPARAGVPNSHDIVEEMAKNLSLDLQQKEQLRAIIQESRDHYRILSRQFQPQYEKIRHETDEAIRALLRPDQLRHFNETLQKMDARPQRGHEPQSPPPGPSK